jgi:hypothetical protein
LPGGVAREYLGRGPFYFGTQIGVGDWNKNPWAVDPRYKNQVVVRGHRTDGAAILNFGYWPTGYGTPMQLADVVVSFTRQDTEGRTVVYQPELRLEAEPDGAYWRLGSQFWSFPSAGCYAIEASGAGLDETTK